MSDDPRGPTWTPPPEETSPETGHEGGRGGGQEPSAPSFDAGESDAVEAAGSAEDTAPLHGWAAPQGSLPQQDPGPEPDIVDSGFPFFSPESSAARQAARGPQQTYGPPPPPGYLPAGASQFSQNPPTMPLGAPVTKRPAPPGWIWPVIGVVALVTGLIGGVLGSVTLATIDRAARASSSESGGLTNAGTRTEAPLDPATGSVAAVAAEMLPSTVQVLATLDGESGAATGSGFVIDELGHIVTNNHVVADAAADGTIRVVDSEGKRHEATLVGRSPVYDLAVLEVKGATTLRPAALGASASLNVGDDVVAIGSPLGLSSTVTSGIVSALNRPVTTGEQDESYINAVQTDAAINPGNSGGPLVNLAGQVVGVNSAIATTGTTESGNIGVGFAIPIEQVTITADQILSTGEARYPIIGASVQTTQQTDVGALVEAVVDASPAEAAGLRKGDVITQVDGELVTDGIALIVAIRTHQPGESLEFTIERGGREQRVTIRLDSRVG